MAHGKQWAKSLSIVRFRGVCFVLEIVDHFNIGLLRLKKRQRCFASMRESCWCKKAVQPNPSDPLVTNMILEFLKSKWCSLRPGILLLLYSDYYSFQNLYRFIRLHQGWFRYVAFGKKWFLFPNKMFFSFGFQCMLEKVGNWNFDIFLFDRLTNGKIPFVTLKILL